MGEVLSHREAALAVGARVSGLESLVSVSVCTRVALWVSPPPLLRVPVSCQEPWPSSLVGPCPTSPTSEL